MAVSSADVLAAPPAMSGFEESALLVQKAPQSGSQDVHRGVVIEFEDFGCGHLVSMDPLFGTQPVQQ
jgi:hypothetical protein